MQVLQWPRKEDTYNIMNLRVIIRFEKNEKEKAIKIASTIKSLGFVKISEIKNSGGTDIVYSDKAKEDKKFSRKMEKPNYIN